VSGVDIVEMRSEFHDPAALAPDIGSAFQPHAAKAEAGPIAQAAVQASSFRRSRSDLPQFSGGRIALRSRNSPTSRSAIRRESFDRYSGALPAVARTHRRCDIAAALVSRGDRRDGDGAQHGSGSRAGAWRSKTSFRQITIPIGDSFVNPLGCAVPAN
jgi:hypothetical protein